MNLAKTCYRGTIALLLLFPYTITKAQHAPCVDFPTVTFVGRSYNLSKDVKNLLIASATKVKDNPECRIKVKGFCSSSKNIQQLSWERVNSVVSFLIENEGIRPERIIFLYGEADGDCNTVEILSAQPGEEGPSFVPAPHPNLRRKR